MAALAAKPVTWFDTEADAVDRYLRVSGLATLVTPSSLIALDGVVERDGRFRLANDTMTAAIGAPDVAGPAGRVPRLVSCSPAEAPTRWRLPPTFSNSTRRQSSSTALGTTHTSRRPRSSPI